MAHVPSSAFRPPSPFSLPRSWRRWATKWRLPPERADTCISCMAALPAAAAPTAAPALSLLLVFWSTTNMIVAQELGAAVHWFDWNSTFQHFLHMPPLFSLLSPLGAGGPRYQLNTSDDVMPHTRGCHARCCTASLLIRLPLQLQARHKACAKWRTQRAQWQPSPAATPDLSHTQE